MNQKLKLVVVAAGLLAFGQAAQAEFVPANGVLENVWDGWTQFQVDDGETDPGAGGQKFDAEFLYYRKSGSTFEIGLQAGFDLEDGKVRYGGWNYWAGDLALSFDNDDSQYEYAIDFGLKTKDYDQNLVDVGSGTGIDPAGLYSVSNWNNNVIPQHSSSVPLAMDDGVLVANLLSNASGSGMVGGYKSYYRQVGFDLSAVGVSSDNFSADMHWTMSCGNDVIEGTVNYTSVPAPSMALVWLAGLAFFSIAASRRRNTTSQSLGQEGQQS